MMNDKRQAEFAQDVFKVTGFDAVAGGNRVAVHRVARPDDRQFRRLHRFDKLREFVLNLVGAESMDQHDFARLVFRIKNPD